ncbi:hypothetical protein SDC9_161034 [bioreactor metagenome]|uniref:Uncharacterized protein n=1 Tax=bioreactor metagenome TaxID=1076179 RepID=A0A645FIC3_9ZZZZ
MANDKHISCVVEKLPQRLTKEAHLHAALQRLRLPSAAVKHISAAFFDDGLIAPTPKRKLHRLPRALVRAGDAIRRANRDRKRYQHAGSRVDVVRLLQQRKARAFQLRQMLCLKYHEKPPVFIAPVYAVNLFHEIRHQTLHLGKHAGFMKLHIGGKLFVVVDVDQRHIRHLLLKEALIVRRLGAIQPVLKEHRALILLAIDGHAHDLIDIARVFYRHGDQRRIKVKMRLDAADVRFGEYLLHTLVAPGELSIPFNQRTGD